MHRLIGQHAHRLADGFRRGHGVALFGEHQFEQLPHAQFVVDDQQVHSGTASLRGLIVSVLNRMRTEVP